LPSVCDAKHLELEAGVAGCGWSWNFCGAGEQDATGSPSVY